MVKMTTTYQKITKNLLFLNFLFCVCTNAHAAYHRFWIGFKKDSLSSAEFSEGLQKKFFQKTIEIIKPFGLVAYQPLIIPKETTNNLYIPDEVALVTYESESAHAKFKESSIGTDYVELHWDYFNRENSKSAVPESYNDELKVDHAYDLKPTFTEWQKYTTSVSIFKNENILRLKKYVESLKKNKNILGGVILIKDTYVVLYISTKSHFKNKPPAQVYFDQDLKPITVSEISDKTLGANFQFH